jgi:hypothetical protein
MRDDFFVVDGTKKGAAVGSWQMCSTNGKEVSTK